MEGLLIAAIILIVGGIILGIASESSPLPTCFVGLGVFFATSLYYKAKIENEPSAMDVYKGKTRLEITYKDTVAVDSAVIFINN